MASQAKTTAADQAAEAFYGQSENAFAKQVAEICRADKRLIAVFQRTRAQYEAQKLASR